MHFRFRFRSTFKEEGRFIMDDFEKVPVSVIKYTHNRHGNFENYLCPDIRQAHRLMQKLVSKRENTGCLITSSKVQDSVGNAVARIHIDRQHEKKPSETYWLPFSVWQKKNDC